ncbi:MAG: phenylalanine--tRNA ligase subunit beta [Sphingobacteriales bacterium]|nr:MAG: phenylalanine--tRNA ligase subunit beta [Sphingobacteriales bacterium]
MKISYNWLKTFINTNLEPQQISTILTNIGLEVESLDEVQAVPGGLKGLVVGHVLTCVQHPNADRLRITQVNVGLENPLQIVCGAPNVAAGQKVIVATVGCTVYPLAGDAFAINKSKIRGEVSEGMICAEDEIGLGKGHDGILVLPEDTEIGLPAKNYFKLNDDYLFEIGLTPNRADATSHLGVARDLAAYLKTNITKPNVDAFKTDNENLFIHVLVEDEIAAPRYSGLTISGITVAPSPKWLTEKLAVIGVKAINNVVDATNYVLHDLGQPLHAFDADEIAGHKIIVKKCAEGTLFTTLDGVERKLTANDLMICDAEKPLCIAGVYGGLQSGVSQKTTSIFLESAYFNAVSVRKTSKLHNLKTDASFRFERGTDPEITVYALKRAALLIQELAGGTISSNIFDNYPNPIPAFDVELSYAHVQQLIGKNIPETEIKAIIQSLAIDIVVEDSQKLQLKIPTYRVDVTRDVDVIEEILRIYGYDNIEIPAKINASLNNISKPDKDTLQNHIADSLSANGFFEMLSNSLTKSSYPNNQNETIKILNPLSSDLDVMRQTLLYNGLEAISYNQNRKASDLKLYEFGKTYHLIDEKFKEINHLSLFITGNLQAENWQQKQTEVSFFNTKNWVDGVLSRLGINNLITDDGANPHFAYSLQYKKGDKVLVEFGAVAKPILKSFGIDKPVFYANFNWDLVLKTVKNNKIFFQEISKFPAVRRDLSLLIDTDITFAQLHKIASKTEKSLLKTVNVFDVYVGDKLPEGKKSYALSFILQDDDKTLTDKQIDSVMQKLIFNLEKEAKAEVRKG